MSIICCSRVLCVNLQIETTELVISFEFDLSKIQTILQASVIFIIQKNTQSDIMPQVTVWYCGWCSRGPMNIRLDHHCVFCHRQKDGYSIEQSHYISSDRRLDNGAIPSPSLGGNSYLRSAFDSTSAAYGRAAPTDLSYGYHGSSGATSYGQSSPTTYSSIPPNTVPKGDYGPVTRGYQRWFCCQCGSGPALVATTPRCINIDCSHIKCTRCIIE